jgi:glycosyltransferase involved in cell wall biosynthesis
VHLVVKQAARWPRVQFRIAGQGDEEERCRGLAQQLGCINVSFLGHLSQPELGDEMRTADVFFFPSEVEGHPQVLGQAAACGLPCVAMESYHPDFVRDGETGFLARSDEELAEKLDLLLTHTELRRSMSSAAVVHMGRFDWDWVTRCWQDVFEDVVKRKHESRA